MFAQLVSTYHLHQIGDNFTIALPTLGIAAELLPPRRSHSFGAVQASYQLGASVDLTAAATIRWAQNV
jgi:hypothetical protein